MTNLFGSSFAALALVFFFFAPSNARLITEATNDVINDICAKTSNPSYCSGVLSSAGTTDLKGLAQHTIKLAKSDSKDAFNEAKSLLQKETNPKLQEIYKSCAENFDNAVDDLEQAEGYLNSGDYGGVNVAGSGAMTEADTCSDDLSNPAPSSPLLQNVKIVEDTCSIIEVIGNALRGRSH